LRYAGAPLTTQFRRIRLRNFGAVYAWDARGKLRRYSHARPDSKLNY
jgi:hypothetical protein